MRTGPGPTLGPQEQRGGSDRVRGLNFEVVGAGQRAVRQVLSRFLALRPEEQASFSSLLEESPVLKGWDEDLNLLVICTLSFYFLTLPSNCGETVLFS